MSLISHYIHYILQQEEPKVIAIEKGGESTDEEENDEEDEEKEDKVMKVFNKKFNSHA